MALPKTVLIALSSYNGAFYPDGAKTGVFYVEAAHPYHAFAKAGYKIQFVSETGSFGFDEHSLSKDFASQEEIDEHNDSTSAINKSLKAIKRASDVDAKDYGIFFAAGGHGTIFDFPGATTLQKLALEIYEAGGVVSAVCHGPAIFENLKDSKGDYLISGKKVTGFTDEGEEMMQLTQVLKDNNVVTPKTAIEKAGGIYVAPPSPFEDFTVVDGRIASGVNPASATSLAQKVDELFKSL